MPDSPTKALSPPAEHWVDVERHRLRVLELGNPNGIPVVVLHGGPGGVSDPKKASLFDRRHFRILMFDQRGCGASTPSVASFTNLDPLSDNKTSDLIDDIQRVKQALGINEPWVVAGGSFGSTLGLLYAARYPREVAGLLLWAIFLPVCSITPV